MNKQQKQYVTAKAAAETITRVAMENEKQFLIESRIKNPDGETPTALWQVEDEDEFLRLCEEWEASPLNIISDVKKTEIALKTAEDNLIDYALSIIPADIAKTLNEHRQDYNTRVRLLDITLNLDTRTVKNR